METTTQEIRSAVQRTKEAIARRAKLAQIAEAERQKQVDDEALIRKARERLTLVSRYEGIEQDQIHQLEHDIATARRQITQWTEAVARQEIELEEHKRTAAPLAKELAELRALLADVD